MRLRESFSQGESTCCHRANNVKFSNSINNGLADDDDDDDDSTNVEQKNVVISERYIMSIHTEINMDGEFFWLKIYPHNEIVVVKKKLR